MADTIVLKPRTPSNYRDELDGMVEALREAFPDADVRVEMPPPPEAGKYGVVYAEILNVVIEVARDSALAAAWAIIVDRAKAGWNAKQKDKPRPRPRSVNLLGPDGELIRRVRIPPEEDEEE